MKREYRERCSEKVKFENEEEEGKQKYCENEY